MRRNNIFALTNSITTTQNALNTLSRIVQLSQRDRDLFKVLHRLALERAALQHGLARLPSFEVIALPAELLAAHTELSTGTLYRSLDSLEKSGLICRAALFGTLRGQSVKAGTLFSVVLNPARDHTARIPYSQFKAHRRNLDRDVKRRHTAWEELKKHRASQGLTTLESQSVPAGEPVLPPSESLRPVLPFQVLQTWAVTPVPAKNPVILDSPSAPRRFFDLYTLGEIALCRIQDRAALVDEWARGLSAQLGDKSLDVWRWLAWQITRAKEQGRDYVSFVLDAISRARADHQEGFARTAGALLVTRLKKSGVWDDLQTLPLTRVGSSPNP